EAEAVPEEKPALTLSDISISQPEPEPKPEPATADVEKEEAAADIDAETDLLETKVTETAEVVSGEVPPITFPCSSCQQAVEAPGEMAGQDAECPFCSEIVKIPLAEELPNIMEPEPPTPAVEPEIPTSIVEPKKPQPAIQQQPSPKLQPKPVLNNNRTPSNHSELKKTIRIDLPDEILNPKLVERKTVFIKRKSEHK
ncbi:hypothetical protein ACFLS1_07950, partial [Verrucomicrobiota bacterium]